VLSTDTYSVKLIRDGQQISIFEPDFELFLYQPIQGTFKRFDFVQNRMTTWMGFLTNWKRSISRQREIMTTMI